MPFTVALFLILFLPLASLASPPPRAADTTETPKISRSKQLEIYSKMQTVCDRWSRWYKRDRSETARINMNISCRDAAQYASSELAIKTGKPKYAAAPKKAKKNSSKPRAHLLSAKKVDSDYSGKPKCSYWQDQVDKIQSKLRGGYKEPQGNKLRQRRRNYWRLIRDNC